MNAPASRRIEVWGGRLAVEVQVMGSGPPLLYLHPASGLVWDPFVQALAKHRTVYAPLVPGTGAPDRAAIHTVDDLWDLVLVYEETVRGLGIEKAEIVGCSFGGMLAAELAAGFQAVAAKLVLVAPIGLWREDVPVWNWMTAPPTELPGHLFHDPTGPVAQAVLMPPADPNQAIAAQAAFVWALGCTGKFVWPIPEKGLHKRIHRIAAPTLVVWGESDRLIPAAYAHEFAQRIRGAKVEIVPKAGHLPHLEGAERTWAAVAGFLGL